jgi:hypothetical protein
MYELSWTELAAAAYARLEADPAQKRHFKAVKKAIRFLAENPRHPSLNTHEWHSEKCPHGEKLFEAYAENKTSGAYRIFFCYEAARRIQIVAITPHP